ncbi:MAG: AMP-binding protein [Atopobiaceae bacterium]|nr:AMP-binding protein [Atopobiaceae bacterium]
MEKRYMGFDDLLVRGAAEYGDKVALVHGDDLATTTWSELDSQVRTRAAELAATGKTSMAVLANGSQPCFVEILAANIAGLQVTILDESTPDALMPLLLAGCEADCLWCSRPERAEALATYLGAGVTDGARRVLFLTSGTTSRSKFVALTDESLMAAPWTGAPLFPLEHDDRLLCILPMAHVFGFVCGILWPLHCGAEVALGRGPRHYVDDCRHFAPTAISVVPNLLAFLMGHNLLNDRLKAVLVGAGDCGPELLAALQAKVERVAFGYGLTETSSGVALGHGADPRAMEVCHAFEVTIADDGEVLIASDTNLMLGYYRRPEDTAAVVVDGVLHTGDLGYLDEDGCLHITGRKKEMLVLGSGTKVFLPEYEGEIHAALGTPEAAVALVNDKLTLVLGKTELTGAKAMELIADVQARTPRAQQITRVIELGHELPRTATGKLKRWELQGEIEG